MKPTRTGWLLLALLVSSPAIATAEKPQEPGELLLAAAHQAYETGRCTEVVSIFDKLSKENPSLLDGISQYQWGFCVARLRRGPAEPFYRKAAEMLEARAAEKGAPLDAHFYLVNALLNLDRRPEAVEAALRAVEASEKGAPLPKEDDARGWFRLGKLFRDAELPEDALDPFRQAVGIAEKNPGALRPAYLERILNHAIARGDTELARRTHALSSAGKAQTPATAFDSGRIFLAQGGLDDALEFFTEARRARGDAGMAAQYAYYTVKRAQEVARWKIPLPKQSAAGESIAEMDDDALKNALRAAAVSAFQLFAEPGVETARRRGPGTRLSLHPETRQSLRKIQAEFVALCIETILRKRPLRPWATEGGFMPLIHKNWARLALLNLEKTRTTILPEQEPQSPR